MQFKCKYLCKLIFHGFFERWTPPYFLSYYEQACLFEFSSLAIILKHNLCFINAMLLLTADPLPPFTSLLFVSAFSFSFSHTFPTFSQSFLFRSIHHLTLPKIFYPLPLPFNLSTMSPAKGKSFSRRKVKEVATDDPPTETVGEEAPYSKSDHFEKEEGGRDPGSKFPPLINLWYDTHTHFPVVFSDYSPPLLGHVWLSLCRHDSEVS